MKSFQIKKTKKETIDTTIKDIRNLFELEKGNKAIKDRTIRDIRKSYLKDIINGTWKIQLTMKFNFIYSKDDNDENHEMHSKRDNIEIMID